MVNVAVQQATAPARLGLAQELLNILTLFHDPGRAFRSIAGAPRYFVPLVLLAALSVGMDALGRMVVPSDVRLAARIAQAQSFGIAASSQDTPLLVELGVVALFSILAVMAASLVFWFAFRVGGERLKYKPVLATCSYAMLPPALIWTLMAGAILLIADPNNIDPQRLDDLVPSNIGALFHSVALSPFFESVLSSFDAFSVWIMALTVVGMGVWGVSRRKASWTVGLVWWLYVMGKGAVLTVMASLAQ